MPSPPPPLLHRGGTVVVVDPQQRVLSRLWTVYQAWMGAYYSDSAKLQVAFPGEMCTRPGWGPTSATQLSCRLRSQVRCSNRGKTQLEGFFMSIQ